VTGNKQFSLAEQSEKFKQSFISVLFIYHYKMSYENSFEFLKSNSSKFQICTLFLILANFL